MLYRHFISTSAGSWQLHLKIPSRMQPSSGCSGFITRPHSSIRALWCCPWRKARSLLRHTFIVDTIMDGWHINLAWVKDRHTSLNRGAVTPFPVQKPDGAACLILCSRVNGPRLLVSDVYLLHYQFWEFSNVLVLSSFLVGCVAVNEVRGAVSALSGVSCVRVVSSRPWLAGWFACGPHVVSTKSLASGATSKTGRKS